MSDENYRPWRTAGEPVALVPDATRQWNDLVEESRRSIAALRELRNGIDVRLQAGLKVIKAIDSREAHAAAQIAAAAAPQDATETVTPSLPRATPEQLAAEAAANEVLNFRIIAIEDRLAALEKSISRLGAPTLSIRRHADDAPITPERGPDPLQHLLTDLLASAA